MELIEVLSRHRNDFHWKGRCRHCGHVERYGDGYADEFYCLRIVPARHCPECELNCYGQTHDEVQRENEEREREAERERHNVHIDWSKQ